MNFLLKTDLQRGAGAAERAKPSPNACVYPMLSKTSSRCPGAHEGCKGWWQEPCFGRGHPTHQPEPGVTDACPAPPPRLQNPIPIPDTAFRSARSQPRVPGDGWSCLGDQFGLPAALGRFHRPRTARVTWVDDGEDHVAVSLLSFQPIQLLLLITLLPLVLLLLSRILEGKAGKNGVSKATGTARGADGARLAPGEGELQFSGSKASHPTWMGGTSRTLFTFFRDSGTYHSVALFVTFFAPGGEGGRG